MGQKVERMLLAVEPLYTDWDAAAARALKEQDKSIRSTHLELKLYLARIGANGVDENLSQRSRSSPMVLIVKSMSRSGISMRCSNM